MLKGRIKRVTVKLMVDKKKNRVVFAEANKDFVDILFSFLTLPLATVTRVAKKNSLSLGSLINIHDSVANLDSSYFQTEACKTMLLHPRNAAEVHCEDLAINIDDTKPRTFYTCQDCSANRFYSSRFYGSIPNTICSCGKPMSRVTTWERADKKADKDGAFVKGRLTFIISDDLNVNLSSNDVLMSLFKSQSIEEGSMLEDKVLELGPKEIVILLQRSLISKSPLTDLCFSQTYKQYAASEQNKKVLILPKLECDADCNLKELKLKLILRKSDNKVLYAEAEECLVEFLFSVLTFPLWLLIENTECFLSEGCIVNLYKSVESNNFIKSEECKSTLLSPKLPAFYACSGQFLKAEEMESKTRTVPGCCNAPYYPGCRRELRHLHEFKELNPKSPSNGTEPGGGYVKGVGKFMVTDDLHITPFSLISSVQMLNELQTPISGLVEREVSMGMIQALDLLRAASSSHTALSNVFNNKKQ